MTEKIQKYQDLKIWQKGIDLVNQIYLLTKNFPESEKFNLCSQLKRAAVSVPSNIAEGFRRYHKKEYKQFLYVALGSIAELETQMYISRNQSFIKEHQLNTVLGDTDILARMINSLIQKL